MDMAVLHPGSAVGDVHQLCAARPTGFHFDGQGSHEPTESDDCLQLGRGWGALPAARGEPQMHAGRRLFGDPVFR
jgi:hypothetical protein